MIEGRWIIKDIKETKKKIEELRGTHKSKYSFTDMVFSQKDNKLDLSKEFIRLRVYKLNEWNTKNIVLTHKITKWKGNFKKDKIILKKEFDTIKEALDFIDKHYKGKVKKFFEYFRKGEQFQINNSRLFVENIKGFKPSIEIEAKSEKEINYLIKELELHKKVPNSIPETMRKILL